MYTIHAWGYIKTLWIQPLPTLRFALYLAYNSSVNKRFVKLGLLGLMNTSKSLKKVTLNLIGT